MCRLVSCSLVLAVLIFPIAGLTAELDQPAIEKLLKQPIITKQTSHTEVTAFIRPKIVRLPKFTDAGKWRTYAEGLRRRVLDEVVFRGRATSWRDAKSRVVWMDTIKASPEYTIRKLSYEALPGLWIPALLYQPTKPPEGKLPVVLNVMRPYMESLT